MTFEEILPHLKSGKKIRRQCWDEGHYLLRRMVFGKVRIKMMAYGEFGNCTYHSTDNILADDWEVVE